MKIEIFGIQFDNLTMKEAVEQMKSLPAGRQGFVVLPYSEFVIRAQKNEGFKKILNNADFCLCEGKGLYLMARLLGKKLKQEINGIELIHKICEKRDNQTIFLFGGTDVVVNKTKQNLIEKYPNLQIVGAENGYQNFDAVINKINLAKPDILFVALGGGTKQEQWIYENLSKMPSIKLAIGVGGAFDFISRRIKRAPLIFQKIGMEWLWRLIIQPKRFKRIFMGVGGLICLTIKNMLHLKHRK